MSSNALGYDFTSLMIHFEPSAISDYNTQGNDSSSFWFIETIDNKDVYTVLHLSEEHTNLLFYSKTWLFGEVESSSFLDTQETIYQTLCDLYGEPIVQNQKNNLLFFDRSNDPHTKIYAPYYVWQVDKSIVAILQGGKGMGNVKIYTQEKVNDANYYLEINFRIDNGTYHQDYSVIS